MKKVILLKILIVILTFNSTALLYSNMGSAKGAFARKNYEKAITLFKGVIDSQPNRGDAYFYIGYIHEIEGRYAKSIPWLQKAVNRKMTRKLRNLAFWKIINFYKYHKEWENVYKYCQLRLEYGAHRKIQKLMEKADSLRNPSARKARKLLNEALTKIGDNNYSAALSLLKESVSLNSKLYKARYNLALLYLKKKDYSSAKYHFEVLVEHEPKNLQYNFRLGFVLFNLKEYEQSILYLKKAIVLSPKKKMRYYIRTTLGKNYEAMEDIKTARNNYFTAMKLNHSAVAPRLGLARLAYKSGKPNQSLKNLKNILKLKPKHKEALYWTGLIYYDKGKITKATTFFSSIEDSIEKQTTNDILPKYINTNILYYLLGIKADKTNDFSTASKYFSKVNKIPKGKERKFNFYFGKNLYYSNKPLKAMTYLQKVENSSGAYYLLAKIYGLNSNIEQTKKYLILATNIKASFWETALKEQAFKNLMENNESFKKFVLSKGKPPVEKIEPEQQELEEIEKGKNDNTKKVEENTNMNESKKNGSNSNNIKNAVDPASSFSE